MELPLIVALAAFGLVVGMLPLGRLVFLWTYRRERERSFRKTLRDLGYSEREIEKAVEEQGW